MKRAAVIIGLSLCLAGLLTLALDAQTVPVVVPLTASCATSVDGTVVGVRNPLQVPTTAVVYSGTLGSGNYFIQVTWYDAAGNQTLPGPETQVQLVSTGQIQVSPPGAGMPAEAVGAKIYMSTSSGTETLQGSVVGSGTFIQSVPLVTGAAEPSTNTTICSIITNDSGTPSGTGYNVELTSPNGSIQPGYPMQWQLNNPGTTYNLATQGLPLYNGTVLYPIPLLQRPYNHAVQSISGPLSMSGYKLTQVSYLGIGTSVPAWGVDAEVPAGGDPLEGVVSAATGFLVNGNAGTTGQGLCSDGSYLDSFCNFVTSLPTLYYQTAYSNNVAQTQRAGLNFSTNFVLTDSASPSRTAVELATAGTPGTYSYPSSVTTDAFGRVTAITSSTGSISATQTASLISSDGTSGSRQFYQTANPDSTPPASDIYQNTNTTPLIVTVSADGGGSGFHGVAYCDSSATPTTKVGALARVNDGSSNPNYYPGSTTFVVPPSYYYGISVTNATGTPVGSNALDSWTEWLLH